MYYIWDNPFFLEPLILISDKGYNDMDWRSERSSPKCEVFALEDDRLVSFGLIECLSTSYQVSLGPKGLYTADNHLQGWWYVTSCKALQSKSVFATYGFTSREEMGIWYSEMMPEKNQKKKKIR